MSENGTELSIKQAQTIQALLTQRSIAAAARQSGVGTTTIYRWLNDDPDFRKALTTAEGVAIDAAARSLVGMTERALDAVSSVLDDQAAHPAVKLKAAEIVLGNMLRLFELRNLEKRIAALEKEGGSDEQ